MADQRNGESEARDAKVVVGVDGSETSLAALRWAGNQSSWMGVPLEVVTAWDFPEHPAPLGVEVKVPWPDELMAQASVRLEQIVSEVLREDQRRAVRAKVVRGSAVPVLLAESRRATLLVVGSRGRSLLQGVLLGSVSERCVRHAECPVLVVR